MATSGVSSVKSKQKSWSISTALASAVLEWLLICMLFINAIFSYLITKFACQWELQTPCLLCSRLDHILGTRNLKYYRDLICGDHKLEISSLVFCHAHNNLVDVHGMCENCLFSFATVNKSNAETYRLLVGKLGEDSSLDQDPLLDDRSSVPKLCSCCNEPWIPRGYCQTLIQATSVGSGPADLDVPLSGTIKHDWCNLKKSKRSTSIRSTRQKTGGIDPLSHVGYTELKFNSDTESEAMFSDDDGANAVMHKDVSVGYVQPEPRTFILVNDSVSEKLIDPVSAPEPSILTSKVQPDFIKSHTVTAKASAVPIGYDLEELNWQQADCKADSSALPELISHNKASPSKISRNSPRKAWKGRKHIYLDEIPQSSYVKETPLEASNESKIISVDNVHPSSERSGNPVRISEDRKLISLSDFLPSSNGAETPVQGLTDSCIAREEEVRHTSVSDCEDLWKAENQPTRRTDTASEINQISGDNGQQFANLLDLSDAYKLAVGNRGRQLSGVLTEQRTGKDSSKLGEDLKLLLSQLSAAREQSMSPRVSPRIPVSPKLSLNSDDLKTSDASSVIGMQILQRRITLERNESGLSLDGSIVSEIEGESDIDRLKRQVEHDKKLLSALYKELEEERNASTIAANQALAMITRLQEEKATLHMEARQYLRMMEEQSEYDMEAMQKMNDLLTEKEKEIQDLEEELEFYRSKFPDESVFGTTISDRKETGTRVDNSEAGCIEDSTTTSTNLVTEKPDVCHTVDGTNMSLEDKNIGAVNCSLLEFEDERSYLIQGLKKLKRKIYLFSNKGLSLELINGKHSEGDEENDLRELNDKVGVEQHSGAEENELLMNGRGIEPVQGHVSFLEKSFSGNENSEIFYSGESSPVPLHEIDLDSLVNEVSDLSERLGVLEADRNFLEHSINSIRYGEEGVQFIKEIASHLKELRRSGYEKGSRSKSLLKAAV